MHPKRIVIIGPESTGKSTLTQQLADHYNAPAVPEFARAYLEQISRPYTREDLAAIAAGQVALEEEAIAAGGEWVFCDTDLYVIKVWSESRYDACDEAILKRIAERRYDLYLLTDIDMPWEDDPLREHPQPEMRAHFFNVYKDIVVHSGVPFAIVKGSEAQRLSAALQALQRL